jgi:hypothetical protein
MELISGFRRDVDELYALLGYYTALSGSYKGQEVLLGFLDPWRWDRQVVPKRWYRTTTQRCVISQKRADLENGVVYDDDDNNNNNNLETIALYFLSYQPFFSELVVILKHGFSNP